MSEIYAIYGASGCGRGIMPLARRQLAASGVTAEQLFFIDDNCSAKHVNGHRVLSYQEFCQQPASRRSVALAIANSEVRSKLADKCQRDGMAALAVRAENAVVMDNVQLGEGGLLSPFVTVTSNIVIGDYFHANLYSYVEHDCVIGDFVTFAPGACCNGNVIIESFAYIGARAVIKQGSPGNPLVIGKGAVVGMGAVVTRSVPAGATVVGNPARPINR